MDDNPFSEFLVDKSWIPKIRRRIISPYGQRGEELETSTRLARHIYRLMHRDRLEVWYAPCISEGGARYPAMYMLVRVDPAGDGEADAAVLECYHPDHSNHLSLRGYLAERLGI